VPSESSSEGGFWSQTLTDHAVAFADGSSSFLDMADSTSPYPFGSGDPNSAIPLGLQIGLPISHTVDGVLGRDAR